MTGDSLGFTLVEALVVLALMATVLITLFPMVQWLSMQGTRHAVEALQSDLQLARCMAISRKQSCSVKFNQPSVNQYHNLLNRENQTLNMYRGGVHFMQIGPDGTAMAEEITFNRQGMSASIVPADIFISGDNEHQPYRIRVLLPGGIAVYRWNGKTWQ